MAVGQFNLKTWFQYMENLARSFTLIGHTDTVKHFVRGTFAQLVQSEFKDLHSPALVVDAYDDEGIDNKSDNLLIRRYIVFTVMKRLDNKGDGAELLDSETDCETIGLKIVARMYRDRRTSMQGKPKPQLFADVALDARTGDFISELLNGMWAAYRVTIPIINADDRLKFNSADWNDAAEKPILEDISDLSCSNLNDPSVGLTDEQRLNCLAVTIYESDGTTVDTLVPAGGSFTQDPATVCAGVDVVDQDDNVIAHVNDGDDYNVVLADYVVDLLTPTTDVIIDPL